MKKLLNVKNLIVALALVIGLTGIASFVSASKPIATIQYAGKNPIEISKETRNVPNISIWYQDFENQNVEIDIFDYPTQDIELSVLKPDGTPPVPLKNIDENPDVYYKVVLDTQSGKEKVQLNITKLLSGDGVYTIQAKKTNSQDIDFEIHIIVDNTPPVVEVFLGKGQAQEQIINKDDLEPKYSADELTVKVQDENFDPENNKGTYTIPGVAKKNDKDKVWTLQDGFMVATFVLPQGENTLDVTVTDEAGNEFVLPGNSNPTFIVDTEGPNIDISIKNEKYISGLNIEIKDTYSPLDLHLDSTNIEICYKQNENQENWTCDNTYTLEKTSDNVVHIKGSDNLGNGILNINVTALDELGNPSNMTIESLILDKTIPGVTVEFTKISEYSSSNNEESNENIYKEPTYVKIIIDEHHFEEAGLKFLDLKEELNKKMGNPTWKHEGNIHTATFTPEDGEYKFKVLAEDLAGNQSDPTTSLSFTIDTKAPEINVKVDDNPNFIEGEEINLGVRQNLTLKSEIKDANLKSETETFSLVRLEDNVQIFEDEQIIDHEFNLNFSEKDSTNESTAQEGTYKLTITATDKAGRTSNKEITFSIDRTAPTIGNYQYSDVIVEENETETNQTVLYFNKNTVIELPVIDENLDLGKSLLLINNKDEYSFNNEEYSFGSLAFENNSLKIEFKQDGEYTIDLKKVLDEAGNETEKFPEPLKIVVDKTPPVLNFKVKDKEGLDSILDKYEYTNDNLTIYISIEDLTDTDLTCEYTTESQSTEKSKECSLTPEGEGDEFKLDLGVADEKVDTFNIKLTAEDIVGYQTTEEFSITIDKVKPVVDYAVNGQISKDDQGVYYFNKGTTVDVLIEEHHFDADLPSVTYEYRETKDSSPKKFTKDKNDLVWNRVTDNENTYDKNDLVWNRITDNENTYKATIELEDEGYYSFNKVSVDDKAGNRIEETQPLNLAIDKTPPQFVYTDVVKLSNKDQKLTINVNDITYKDLTYTVTKTNYVTNETPDTLVDNETTPESELVLDKHFKTDGTYHVKVTAVDWAGNSSEISQEGITFTIDKVAPVVSHYGLNAEIREDNGIRYYSEDQEIKVYIDEYHFDSSKVKIDLTGEWKLVEDWKQVKDPNDQYNNQYVATIKVEKDGYYELNHVDVIDQVGNEEEVKAVPQKFVIDKVKPVITVSDIKNDFYYKKGDKVTINVSIDETNFNPNLSTYTIYRKESLNSEEKVYLSGNITSQTDFKLPTLTENGEYRVVLTAKDMSDNQVAEDTKLHFYIDHHDPKVSIKPVTANTANGSQQNVSEVVIGLSATDDWKLANTKYTVKRNNEVINVPKQGEWEDFKLSFKDEGYYQVDIETSDEAGTNTVKETLEFTIDRTSPAQLSIVGNANHHNSTTSIKDGESYSAPRVNLQFTAQDAYSFNQIKVDVTKNGKAYASQTFDVKDTRKDFTNAFGKNANYSLSEEGEYEVTFTAYDQAGNQSNQKLSFEIDRTTPIITSNIEDGKYYNEDFLPEFTLDQPERDEFTFINIDGKNYKDSVPFLINDKVYTISALATDKAQNTVDYNATITIDKTNPTIGISNLITGFFKDTLSPSIFYNDTNLDASKVSIKLNNVELGAGVGDENGYTKEININKDGNYTLEVTVGDLATNISKQTIDFVLDNEKPVINIKNKISLHNQPWLPELEVLEEHGYDIVMATLNGEEYDITQPITTEGKNVLFLQVADKSGNTESVTVEFILDLTPPKVIIENAETNQLVKDGAHSETSLDLKIYLDYVQDGSNHNEEVINAIVLDGNDITTNITPKMENGRIVYDLSLTEFKDYTLTVKAKDDAGNTTVETITFTLGDKDIFTKIYENKPVFYSIITIAGLSVVGASIYVSILMKNKGYKKVDSSEE